MAGKAHNVRKHAVAPFVKMKARHKCSKVCRAFTFHQIREYLEKMEVEVPVEAVDSNKRCCVCKNSSRSRVARPTVMVLVAKIPTRYICITCYSVHRKQLSVRPGGYTGILIVCLFFLGLSRLMYHRVESFVLECSKEPHFGS